MLKMGIILHKYLKLTHKRIKILHNNVHFIGDDYIPNDQPPIEQTNAHAQVNFVILDNYIDNQKPQHPFLNHEITFWCS